MDIVRRSGHPGQPRGAVRWRRSPRRGHAILAGLSSTLPEWSREVGV